MSSNKKPISYLQCDSRWKSVPYNGKGESDKTIGSSGCGPTSCAMMVATLRDSKITPVEACVWSISHGHKIANCGSTYAFISQYLDAFGIGVREIGGTMKNDPNNAQHAQVKKYLEQGYYVIALMGTKKDGSRGTWTTGGHFIVVWDWDDKVRILDPISVASKRLNGDPATFKDEVRHYWIVDAREHNGKPGAVATVVNYDAVVNTTSQNLLARREPGSVSYNTSYPKGTQVHISLEQDGYGYTGEGWCSLQYLKKVAEYPVETPKKEETKMGEIDMDLIKQAYTEMMNELKDNDCSSYSAAAREWAIKTGIIQGGGTIEGEPNYMWESPMTREQFVTMLYRYNELKEQGDKNPD